MDKVSFDKYYGFMRDSIKSGLDVPFYCVNHCCGSWSSPSYCFFQREICVRSILLFNLKQLPKIPVLVQLSLFD